MPYVSSLAPIVVDVVVDVANYCCCCYCCVC